MSDNNNDNGGQDELVIDRSHIECDCCGKPGPTKNCSRCLSYYYCNRECQLHHWSKQHKNWCLALKNECDKYKEKLRIGEGEGDEDKKEKEECAICLEEIELPISLECGHVFCVSCLIQYQATNADEGTSCPNCRGDIDDRIGFKASEQINGYIERANRSMGAEREVYVKLILQQIEASLSIHSCEEDWLQLGTLLKKSSVYEELNMPREVIETVDEFMNLGATTDISVDVEWVLQAMIAKAKAYLGLEEWQTALEMYKVLHEDCKEHKKYYYFVAAGISRAQYELQNYYEAIIEGDRATYRDNRYRAGGVHKYIALSQMKLGDIAGAKKSITRGILYEEQWNEENRKKNEEVLRMILAEEEKNNNKPKGKKKGKKKGRGKK